MNETDPTVISNSHCVLIPTYNNGGTLKDVISKTKTHIGEHLIVVNDGSTDNTAEIIEELDIAHSITHSKNQGKGSALISGFKLAKQLGYKYAVTLDSDGQHDPDHIPEIIQSQLDNPDSLIIGSRNMDQEAIPGNRSFGNKFARFWYWVQTGIKIPDTQSGFRSYPLTLIDEINPKTRKFELETELLVKAAWKDVTIIPISIPTIYLGKEGVSHFKPSIDFTRISILNTYYVFLAILYYLPKRLFFKKGLVATIKEEAYKNEPSHIKAASIGFGLLMSVTPIWGLQSIVGLPIAMLFRLNKVLFLLFVNLSIPPFIPLIIYLSFLLGAPFTDGSQVADSNISSYSMESIQLNLVQYTYGSLILAICCGCIGFIASYFVVTRLNKK